MNSSLLEYAKAAVSEDKSAFPSTDLISMFIYGPSQSLKTSIAMDLASNISKTINCQICGEYGCDCCFFVMIKAVKKRTALGFPLVCYHRDKPQEEAKEPNAMDLMVPISKRERRIWSENTLRHIQIKYMSKFSDVVRFLASVQLLPPPLRPQLGIIMDDVECFLDDVGDAELESKVDGKDRVLGDQNTPTAKRNTFLSNEQAIKLLHMTALIRDTITSQSLFPKGLHFVGCMDSDATCITKPIISMIQHYIPVFVTIQRHIESESCHARCCWAVEFIPSLSGYEPRHMNDSNSFKVKCEVIEENWFHDENNDNDNVCDYSTHRLEWW